MTTRQDNVADACTHQNLAYLGHNRDARFLRCESCETVFVLHGGEAWGIPPATTRDEGRQDSE